MTSNTTVLYVGANTVDLATIQTLCHHVDHVESQSSAFRALANTPYDAVMIDDTIAVKDAMALFEQIRWANKTILEILIVSNPIQETLLDAIKLQLFAVLTTPLTSSEMEQFTKRLRRATLSTAKMFHKNILLGQYKNALDSTMNISKTNTHGVITYVNDKFCTLTGYEANEIIGKTHQIFKHPFTTKEQMTNLWKTIQSKKVWSGLVVNTTKTGKPIYTDTFIIPILNERYETQEYMDMRIDVTAVHEQKHHVQEMLDTQISLVVTFEDNNIVMCNQKVLDFFNVISLDEFLLHYQCICNQAVKAPDCISSALFKKWLTNKHQLFSVQIALPKSNGEVHIFNATKAYLSTNDTILSMVDITEMNSYRNTLQEKFNRATQEIRDQQSKLIAQSRSAALGEMFDNIAHQWRQPIGAINNAIINAEFALELEGMSQDEILAVFGQISTYTAFLSDTIDDFRNFSNPDKEKALFSPHTIIRQTLGILQGSFEENGIFVTYIPTQQEEGLMLFGAQGELSQVVLNLLGNARDVLRDKGIFEAYVHVALHGNDKEITIEVTDNGDGIPLEVLPKIFDPYFSTKNKAQGTGIGLYMSKTIIEKHYSGTLEAKNSEEGTVFTITIPVVDPVSSTG